MKKCLVLLFVVFSLSLWADWNEAAKVLASDGAGSDQFGISVSISGDYAIVGAYEDDDNGIDSGSAYIFNRSGDTWTEQAKLTASDAAASDYFGWSVSISGDYAIVGAYRDDDNGSDSGSAYVFSRSGTSWTEQAKLTASDAAASDYFGGSVSISGDYAIVGAYADDDNGPGSGSAYVFSRSGTSWTEQAKLTASDGAVGDFFGGSVSISGNYAIVGAYADDDNGSWSGSAYIFNRSGDAWTEQAKITATDGAASDCFGISVSISGDYAFVGAYYDDSDSGSAYVFSRSGTNWTQQAKCTASDGAGGDRFGCSVSISGDYAVVSANGDDDNGFVSGSAYIFENILFGADFSADQTSVNLGTEIQFTDLSTGTPTSWEWDFDNDGTVDSYEQNPLYTYPNPGTYTVSLTVNDGRSSQNFRMSAGLRNVDKTKEKDSNRTTSTETKVDYITVSEPLPPQISVSPDSLHFDVNSGSQQSQDITISNSGDLPLEVELSSDITVTDIDGNVYQTVQIGDQLWMAENLKVTHYRNGDSIPNVTDNSAWTGLFNGAYCYYDNDANNGDTYGALYNWYAAVDPRGIAPEGWHLPTDEEIKQLEMALGMNQAQANDTGRRGTNEGSKIAGNAALWNNGALENNPEFDSSGFSFLPGGYRSEYNGYFHYMGYYGYLWSSTEYFSPNAWSRLLSYYYTQVSRSYNYKQRGFSVRCVRDNNDLTIRHGENLRSGWLSYLPTTLTIQPGASATITVTADAGALESGDYSDMITISSNDPASSSIEFPVTMLVLANLQADFSADQTSVNLGTEIQFNDLSTGTPTSWEWDFDNDGTVDSYEQNPLYTYPNPGTYTVSLTVSDGRSSQNFRMSAGLRNVDKTKENQKETDRTTSTETKVDYITVESSPDIAVNPTQFNKTLTAGDTLSQILIIENNGSSALDFSIAIAETDIVAGLMPQEINFDLKNRLKTKYYLINNTKENSSLSQNIVREVISPIKHYDSTENRLEETFGSWNGGFWSGGNRDRGNIYHVTTSTTLNEIRFYLNITSSTQLYFFVYQGNSLTGNYNKIDEVYIPDSGTGEGWYSSGTISVALDTGNYYYIGTSWNGTVTYGRGTEYVPLTTSFGTLETGIWDLLAGYPPASSISNTITNVKPYYQTIVTGESTSDWLTAIPISGTISNGSSSNIEVMFNATDLIGDIYTANISITSNDPDEPEVIVPVTLTVTNANPLVANFSGDPTTASLGTEIQFTDLSTGTPTSWEWDFDNDGTVDSYEQNPLYTYPNPRTYTVSLTVNDGRSSQNFRMSAGLRNVDKTKENQKETDRATSTETKVDYITVTGAQLAINPSSLEFGNVVVDDFSNIDIELTNTGNEDILIDSTFAVTPFTVSSNYNTTLSPSQTLSFPVTFQPTATLFYDEQLIIATDIDTFYVDLTGTGVAPTPAWSFNWTSHDFGQTDIDSGTSTNITISNTGNVDLIVSDCNVSDSHFDVSETSFLLEVGDSQNITVSFDPEEILSYNGVISYTSEAGTQELNVSGNGFYQSAAPVLSYVVETRFDGTTGVEPEIGAPGTYFEYRITYTDADNDAPMTGFPQVGIDKNGDHDFLEPDEFMMPLTEIDPTDTSYDDGKEYSFITQLPEDADLGYAFTAYDVLGNPAIGEGTNYKSGPDVTDDYLDLSIYANDITFSESNPDVGDEVVINAVIHNNSDYPADSILIRIYEEDILLEETTIGYLGAQSQTSISIEHIFTAPEYYPIKVVIDEDNVIAEVNELNNFAIRPIVVGNYSVPGAIAATSYLNSSSAYSGGTLRFYGNAEYVETRLRNSVVSGAQVELTISGNGQTWTYTGYTNASGNYSIYFAAPQNLGSYTASAEVTDFTFTTQTSVHNFSVVSPPPSGYPPQQDDLADLKINSCSLSGNPVINNMMEISGSFSNIGDLPAENVKLYLYLDNVLSDSIFIDFLSVDESESYSFYQTWTTVGNHNVSVIVDPFDTVSEYIEYNNSASLSRYIYPEYADLTPVDILFDDNSPLTDQEITITGIIQNLNYIASDATTVEIYDVFSAEGRSESLLGIVNLEPINNNATQNIYFDHTFTAAGLHQIKLVVDPDDLVDESDETNQIIYEAIDVEAPTAELTISAINVSNTNPDVGDAINFSATISNIGSNDAENFEVVFRLDDVQIGSNIPISSLAAGDNQIINSDAWIFDADPHTIEAVIDEADVIPELNEYNNETEKEIGIDLQARKNAIYPGNSSSNPLNIQMGTVVELKSRIYNHGTFAAENVPISYWIEDQLLEMDFVPLINNGVFIQSNIFMQFDSLGNFTVRIFADKQADGSEIFNEIDETNNYVDLYIHVYEESPDLEVLSQYIAPEELNPDPNEEIAIFASIFNQGNIDTDPFWVRILVDDVVLDDSIYIESLPALEDTTVVSNQLYSSAEIGTHTICVEADYNDLLPEFDETNNEAVRNIIVGEAPDLAFTDAGIILSDEEPEQGDLITISAFVKNTGGAEANGNVNWNYVINADTTLINSSNFSVAPQDSAYVSLQWFTAVPFGTIFAEIVNASPEEFNTLNNSAVVGFGSTIQQIGTINAVNVAEDESNYVAAEMDSIFQNVDETPLSYYFNASNDSILISVDSENQLVLNFITNWFGSDESFTVTAENIYGDTISTTVSITVNPVNDAPQILLPASITTYEDSVKIVDFSNFVSDPEQALTELTLTCTESDTINIQIDGLQVTFSAAENWYGMETIEFSIDDNQDRGISYDDVIVIFNPVNDPPTIELPSEFSFEEDQSQLFDLTNYINDVDNDLSELALSSSGSEHISVEISDLFITISSNTQHWNGNEMIFISVSDDASRSARGDRESISDSVMVQCIPVDDPPEFDLPQSLIFGPGEMRQLDFDQYLNEYDGDDLFIQYMGNSNIIVSNDSLLYSFSAQDDYLGCENILFIVYDGTTFAPDQIAVCSSIVPQDVRLELVGSDVEISWREIMAASSYKVYCSDSPEGIFTEVTTGSFSQIEDRLYWHDTFTEDKQFYRVTAFVEETTRGNCNKQEIDIDEELKEKIRKAYEEMYGIKR